jgi:hypothetical protein
MQLPQKSMASQPIIQLGSWRLIAMPQPFAPDQATISQAKTKAVFWHLPQSRHRQLNHYVFNILDVMYLRH